jgi:excisionase family DNA binding protein
MFRADIQLGKGEGVVPGDSNELQVLETVDPTSGVESHESQPEGTFRRSFAAGLLLGADEDEPPLLSVRDVARLLGLSTATVYALCSAGALPTIRILNTIRIRPADVRAFIRSRGPVTRERSDPR